MKRRRHNSNSKRRANNSSGVDPRTLQRAAALLVRAISAELAAGRLPAPQQEQRRPGHAHAHGVVQVTQVTPAPASREEAVKIAARLVTISRACSDIGMPISVAGAWLPLSDVGAFVDRAEQHIRALVNLFDEFLALRPSALKQRGLPDNTVLVTTLELESVRKQITRLDRVAKGTIGFAIGHHYLPPEFRPAGYVEKRYAPGEVVDENERDGDEADETR